MEIGKISNSDLEKLIFKNLNIKRKEVVSSSKVGMDCSIMDFKEDLIVVSTDPITGASQNIGNLAVNISCNDAYCECAEPVGLLMCCLLPKNISKDEIENIVKDASKAADKLNVDIIGGHTEITDAVSKVVIITSVIAKVSKNNIPKRDEIKPGDRILVSKYVGIEGTSIIAHDDFNNVKNILTSDEITLAKSFKNLISVKTESEIAKKVGVKNLHDITEGGLLGAAWEMANSSGYGIEIEKDKVPINEVTKKICNYYKIDPLRLISSGSMLFVAEEKNAKSIIESGKHLNLNISDIGKIVEKGMYLISDKKEKIVEPKPDELYKVIK